MLTVIQINGENLIPLKEAAKSVSYSRDYVARLAREGKIVASQVGRKWFVDVASLRNFSSTSDLHEDLRKTELSSERKQELQANDALIALRSRSARVAKRGKIEALAVTASTLTLGLLVGFSFYTASLFNIPLITNLTDSLAFVSSSVRQSEEVKKVGKVESLALVSEPQQTLLLTTMTERPVFVDESEVRKMSGGADGVLVFGQGREVKTAEEIAGLFSDEVEVKFVDEKSGVISYQLADGKVVQYPFISVPSASELKEIKGVAE